VGSDAPDGMRGTVVALFTSEEQDSVELVRGVGIPGATSTGNDRRQVSLVALEAIEAYGLAPAPRSLGEHLRTRGIDLAALVEGRRLRLGSTAVVQLTERSQMAGIAPCVIARVLRSGVVARGDSIATDAALDRPRFAVVTVSDRGAAGSRPDESGPIAASILRDALGAEPLAIDVLPDDAGLLERRLIALADDEICDLIVTTGGTGLAPRDVTPEATLAVIDREVPGIAEAIRAAGLAKTPFAMLSRAVCGQRGATLIVNLSGSPKAVREQLAVLLPVLPHVLLIASGVPQSCAGPATHAPR